MYRALLVFAVVGLAACGGGRQAATTRSAPAPVASFSSGPIQSACMAAGRKGANSSRCGCVQAAANRTLTTNDRARVAGFFGDPEIAHAMKIDDSPYAEAFWDRYKRFISLSESICR